MENQEREVRLTVSDNDIVEMDKGSPRFPYAEDLLTRIVTAERAAMMAEAQALGLGEPGADGTPSDLWGEMPLAAKEHEVSLGEGHEDPLIAEDSEFDTQGEVSPG